MTLDELATQVAEIGIMVTANRERINAITERLTKIDQSIEEQHRILISIEKLSNGVCNLSSKVDGLAGQVCAMAAKVSELELKPAKRWESVVADLLKLLIAAVVGYAAGQIGLK